MCMLYVWGRLGSFLCGCLSVCMISFVIFFNNVALFCTSISESCGYPGCWRQVSTLHFRSAMPFSSFPCSLRYHLLHPEYIFDRLKRLGRRYELRVLLVYVDIVSTWVVLREHIVKKPFLSFAMCVLLASKCVLYSLMMYCDSSARWVQFMFPKSNLCSSARHCRLKMFSVMRCVVWTWSSSFFFSAVLNASWILNLYLKALSLAVRVCARVMPHRKTPKQVFSNWRLSLFWQNAL